MKKGGILNPGLSRVLAEMGHTDLLVVADAGLPIPLGVERIDLSLTAGVPGALEVLQAILAELAVEGAVLAEEFPLHSPAAHGRFLTALPVVPTYLPHAGFKELMRGARAVVRSGECVPYSNVILKGGVSF